MRPPHGPPTMGSGPPGGTPHPAVPATPSQPRPGGCAAPSAPLGPLTLEGAVAKIRLLEDKTNRNALSNPRMKRAVPRCRRVCTEVALRPGAGGGVRGRPPPRRPARPGAPRRGRSPVPALRGRGGPAWGSRMCCSLGISPDVTSSSLPGCPLGSGGRGVNLS